MATLYQHLIQTRTDLLAKSNALLDAAEKEGRRLTEDEGKQADALLAQIEALKPDFEREERRRQLERETPALPDPTPPAGPEATAGRAAHSGWRMGADRAAEQSFGNFGEQLVAVYRAEQPGREIDPRLARIMYEAAATGANESVPSDGGFLVQQDFQTQLLMPMREATLIAPRCRQVPISANANGIILNGVDETSRVNGSRWGGVQAYWEGEADAITASRPKFRQIDLRLRKLTALYYATDEVLQDSTALESVATQAFGEEMAFKVDDAVVNGSGVGQPLGILGHSSVVSVAKETGQIAATVVYENLIKMWARLPARSRRNAVWLYNQDVEPQLDQLALPVGTAALEPRFVRYGPDGTLTIKGAPTLAIEQAATLGTVGDLILADLSQYLLIDKGGVQQASSIHVRFVNAEQTFRFIYRIDGQPLWRSAVTPFKGSATQSPFVTLDTRA